MVYWKILKPSIMGYSYKIKEEDKFPKGEKKTQDGVESTITDYNPTTRTVEWDIEYVPAFDSVFKEFQELNSYLTSLSNKTDDKEVDEIQMEVKELFNKYRTHIRNNYPEFYKKYQVEEMSTTGGGEGAASFTGGTGMQYATPYAFRKKGQKPNIKAFKYKLVPDKIKGSGLEVNQIFETDTDRGDSLDNFHTQRIGAFDEIENELNQIYQMLSNAKSETVDYYNDSPSSWDVIKPTDLIIDYIKDIKTLLQK